MFEGSSLTSLSSDMSSEHEEDALIGDSGIASAAPAGYYNGPFASQPDLRAVKYLKDTSSFPLIFAILRVTYCYAPQVLRPG